MTNLNKYFFIIISPLLLSYFLPLIFFKNPVIIFYPDSYLIELDNYIVQTYPFTVTMTVFSLIILWALLCFFIINILHRYIISSSKFKYFKNNRSINFNKLYIIFIYLSIIGNLIFLTHNFIIFPESIEQIVHQLSLLPILTVSIGFFILKKNKLLITNKNKLVLYVLIFINIFFPLFLYTITSRIAYVLYMFLAFFFILQYYQKSFKIKLFVLSLIIVIISILMTFKVYIRNNYYYDGKTRIDLIHSTNIEQLFKNNNQPKKGLQAELNEFFAWDRGNLNNIRFVFFENYEYFNYALRRVAGRVNHLNTTVYIYSIFPDLHSFLGFDYLKQIMAGLVPRILWADKPKNESANRLPVYIRLLPPTDTSTSFNLNIIEEGLAFKGILGLVIVALVYSLLAILSFSIATILGNLYLILIPLSIFNLSNTEAGMYGVLNGTLRTLFVYFCMIFLVNFFVKKRN